MFEVGKQYKTRGGEEVTVVWKLKDGILVCVTDHASYQAMPWGRSWVHENYDLLPPEPETRRVEFWVNVYEGEDGLSAHTTKDSADGYDASISLNRIACLHIDREYEKGEGL